MKKKALDLEQIANYIFYIMLTASAAITLSAILASFLIHPTSQHEAPAVQTLAKIEQTAHSPKLTALSVKKTIAYTPDPKEVELIGRTIWGEAEIVNSKAERAAVAWCILNRVDATGKSIEDVVTAYKQFHGYKTAGECPEEHLELAADVLVRWHAEKNGAADVGRTLPSEYLYFVGDGWRNHFSTEYESADYWDWSLPNPYK